MARLNQGRDEMLKEQTAKITRRDGLWIVNWKNLGSNLIGEQLFGNINGALRFCRLRALSVASCEC